MSEKQKYQKKGAAGDDKPRPVTATASKEETKGGRGGRGGHRGAASGGEGRPATQGGDRKPHYQRHKEGAEEGAEERKRPQKEQNKDSWVYKYHYGDRPKFERGVVVTLETEIPPIVPKDQRKRNPDRTEFEDKMRAFDAQIEQVRGKIQGLITKKREAIDGGKVSGSSQTYKEFFSGKITDLKALRDKKNALHKKMDDIKAAVEVLERERQNLLKTLPDSRDLQNPEKIKQTIAELQHRYERTTLKAGEEKKIMNDIKRMQASIPQAERLLEIKPKLDALLD